MAAVKKFLKLGENAAKCVAEAVIRVTRFQRPLRRTGRVWVVIPHYVENLKQHPRHFESFSIVIWKVIAVDIGKDLSDSGESRLGSHSMATHHPQSLVLDEHPTGRPGSRDDLENSASLGWAVLRPTVLFAELNRQVPENKWLQQGHRAVWYHTGRHPTSRKKACACRGVWPSRPEPHSGHVLAAGVIKMVSGTAEHGTRGGPPSRCGAWDSSRL